MCVSDLEYRAESSINLHCFVALTDTVFETHCDASFCHAWLNATPFYEALIIATIASSIFLFIVAGFSSSFSPPSSSTSSFFFVLSFPRLSPSTSDRLVGLVVRRPPRERKIPGSNPACGRIFSGSSHTSDLKIGTPVATLSGAWRYRVSTGTGRPGVSIL